ncbi:hypothetical protein LINGRAHAP2_LOCUS9085 [Linum grandiflorum]
MAWELGYMKVRVQLDSQATVQLLLAERERSHTNTLLRSLVYVSCWIGTGWSKLSMFIVNTTGLHITWHAIVIVYLLVLFYFRY